MSKDTESDIYQEFKHTTMTIVAAIERLERIGYTLEEAKGIVDEWAEDLSAEQDKEAQDEFRW